MSDTSLMSLTETLTLGKTLAESGFFADSKSAAQCVTKILAGRELGFGAIASMTGVYIVKGRVSLSANLIGAAIQRSGKYSYAVKRLDDKGCELEFFCGGESLGFSTFEEKDAIKAQLKDGDNWRKYPRNMYFARAMSNGAKWYTPEVFGGPVYVPEELGAAVDEEGNVIDITPEATAPSPEAQVRQDQSTLEKTADSTPLASTGLETPQKPTTILTAQQLIKELKRGRRKLEKLMGAPKANDSDLEEMTEPNLRLAYRNIGKTILSTLRSQVENLYNQLVEIDSRYVPPVLESKSVKDLEELKEMATAALKKEMGVGEAV